MLCSAEERREAPAGSTKVGYGDGNRLDPACVSTLSVRTTPRLAIVKLDDESQHFSGRLLISAQFGVKAHIVLSEGKNRVDTNFGAAATTDGAGVLRHQGQE